MNEREKLFRRVVLEEAETVLREQAGRVEKLSDALNLKLAEYVKLIYGELLNSSEIFAKIFVYTHLHKTFEENHVEEVKSEARKEVQRILSRDERLFL